MIIHSCYANVSVIRSAAAYVQSMWLIFKHDVKPFVAVFITILIAFAGALYIARHGEYEATTATTSNTTINCTLETDDENCFQSNTTTESSGSNTYPSKTM